MKRAGRNYFDPIWKTTKNIVGGMPRAEKVGPIATNAGLGAGWTLGEYAAGKKLNHFMPEDLEMLGTPSEIGMLWGLNAASMGALRSRSPWGKWPGILGLVASTPVTQTLVNSTDNVYGVNERVKDLSANVSSLTRSFKDISNEVGSARRDFSDVKTVITGKPQTRFSGAQPGLLDRLDQISKDVSSQVGTATQTLGDSAEKVDTSLNSFKQDLGNAATNPYVLGGAGALTLGSLASLLKTKPTYQDTREEAQRKIRTNRLIQLLGIVGGAGLGAYASNRMRS